MTELKKDWIRWYKPRLWKRVAGWLGFKKYQRNYVYGIDLGGQDLTVETSAFIDANGVLNITEIKIKKEDNHA